MVEAYAILGHLNSGLLRPSRQIQDRENPADPLFYVGCE